MNSSKIKKYLINGDCESIKAMLEKDRTLGPSVLAAVLMIAEDAKEKYKAKGISDRIFNDTMADIFIWSENYFRKTGQCGIDELGWIMNHLNLQLFALGRLQFRPSGFYYNDGWEKIIDLPVDIGDRIMEIHIPQGRPLLPEECDRSFEIAPAFFKEFFDYDFKYYTCHSWLLSPILKELLPESSNIIQFQNKFTIIAVDVNDGQAEERIFDKQFGANSNSSLAKKVRELNRNGQKIGSGIGIINKEKINER